MHRPLNDSVRRARIHDVKQAMNGFVAFDAQQCRAENFLRVGIDQHAHEARRFAAFARAADPCHWHLADQRLSAGFLHPGACGRFVHADARERGIGKQRVTGDAVSHRSRFAIKQIGGDDFKIVVRSMRERAATVGIAQRKNAFNVRAQLIIDNDEAARIGLDPCAIKTQIVGIGQSAYRQQQMRAFHFAQRRLHTHRYRDAAITPRDAKILRIQAKLDAFVFEDLLQSGGNFGIFPADDARPVFQHSNPTAEATVHLREFEADITAADDHQVRRQEIDLHHAGVSQVFDLTETRNIGDQRASADIDEDAFRFQHLIIDAHHARPFQASMAFDDTEIRRASEPALDTAIGLAGYRIFSRLDLCHIDAYLAIEHHTVIGSMARDMCRAGAGDQCFGGNATDIHAGAAEQFPLDDRRMLAGLGEAYCQRGAGLPGTNDHCVEFLIHTVSLIIELVAEWVASVLRLLTSLTCAAISPLPISKTAHSRVKCRLSRQSSIPVAIASRVNRDFRVAPNFTTFRKATHTMAQYVYTMNRVGKIVPPKRQILKNISLSFFPGAKIGVLGVNGSGKSTLLKIMAGLDKEIEGEAVPMPGIKIGYLPQEPQLNPDQTVRQSVEEGIGGVLQAKARLDEVYAAYADENADFDALATEQAKLEAIIAAEGGDNTDTQLEIAADALRLPPWEAVVGKLSGGEKRRVALCRLLLSKPDMLLLDEPTNHLDAESVEWLEQFLQKFPGTVVGITHDRYFLDNAVQWILELDRGTGIPYEGNYSSWLEQKSDRLKKEESSESARQRTLKKELEWVRQNPKGRQAKSKARMTRFEELSSYEYQKRNETQEIFIPVAERLGNEVIEFAGVTKSFGERVLIDNLSFRVPPGAIVGVIGPNGAGKSTLFKLIQGIEKPDSGEVKIGPTVNLAFVDQSRDSLPNDKTVWEAISGGADILTIGKFEMQSRAYIGRFNFKGGDQQKLVGNLSGGERGRLHLAYTLLKGANVLLLDEPSNDLDVETLRSLEDALQEFGGSIMVVSHDRWFLDRIATHILACEGDSQWVFYDGNYNEYENDKLRRLGEEGARPKRVRYKALK